MPTHFGQEASEDERLVTLPTMVQGPLVLTQAELRAIELNRIRGIRQLIQEALNRGVMIDPQDLLDTLGEPEQAPERCPAVFQHGPGHQSTARCERKSPHGLEDEHYAKDPMQPGFEWHGREDFE